MIGIGGRLGADGALGCSAISDPKGFSFATASMRRVDDRRADFVAGKSLAETWLEM
jgi:hypothetical protein